MGDTLNPRKMQSIDLTSLFGSLTRVKLLALFLSDESKSYFVRELTRLLNLQINSIRRELENLSNLNIIKLDLKADGEKELKELFDGKTIKKKPSRTDKKYYTVNKEFLFLDELKSLFLKAQTFSKDNAFVDIAEKFPGIVYAILLGKFVNDKEAKLDFLIVGDVPIRKLETFIKKIEKNIASEINFALLTVDEFEYRKQIVDKFLYKILENKKIVLVDKRNDKLFNGTKNELLR